MKTAAMSVLLIVSANSVALADNISYAGSTSLLTTPWGPDAAGSGKPRTFGQTFAPQDTHGETQLFLTSFSLVLGSSSPSAGAFKFRAYIYDWDSSTVGSEHIVGGALFDSGDRGVLPGDVIPASGSQTFTFPVINSPLPILQVGHQYIAVVTTDGVPSPGTGTALVGGDLADPYNAGQMWLYSRTGSRVEYDLATTNWFLANGPGGDMAFSATFVPVPETSHVLLAAVGGLAVIGFARRRFAAAA